MHNLHNNHLTDTTKKYLNIQNHKNATKCRHIVKRFVIDDLKKVLGRLELFEA